MIYNLTSVVKHAGLKDA